MLVVQKDVTCSDEGLLYIVHCVEVIDRDVQLRLFWTSFLVATDINYNFSHAKSCALHFSLYFNIV